MEESTTYLWILSQGETRGEARTLRQTILRQGASKFKGPAPEGARSAIEAIADLERLWHHADRVLVVDSWDALLAE